MCEADPIVTGQGSETETDHAALRVVVIDDAGDFRHLMRVVLERAIGYQVVAEAGDGLEGLAAVRKHRPELVLLDISMPTMGGLEALPLIREACPDTAIVMLSTFDAGRVHGRGG